MAQALIGSLRVNLGLNSAAFQKGLKESGSKLQKFSRVAAKGMAGIAAAGATAVAGIGLAVRGVLNDADQMSKVSKQIGVPIDELSRLRHAAKLSGVDFGKLQTGVSRLSKNMNDAFNGIGEGKRAFDQLGISVKNSDGSMKSSTQVMTEIAAAFAKMPDGAAKTALAIDLMGKSGAKMIPMLNGGATALQNLLNEADELGIVFDQKTATAAEQFNDNMSRLGTVFSAIGMSIAADLAPHLAEFTDWLVANAPQIREFVSNSVENIGSFVTALVSGFGTAKNTFNEVVSVIADLSNRVSTISTEIHQAFVNLPSQMLQIGSDIMDGLWSGIQGKWQDVKNRVSQIPADLKSSFTNFFKIQSPSRLMMEIGQHIIDGLAIGMENGGSRLDTVVSGLNDGVAGAFENIGSGIASAIHGTTSWKNVALDAVRSISSALLNSQGSSGGFGGGIFGSLLKGVFSGLSFDGGGYTGNGSRSGGLDGKGGFMAMLHPKETVIDHARGNVAGMTTYAPVYHIDARGADQAAIARLEQGLKKRDLRFSKDVQSVNHQTQMRNIRG